MCTLASRWRCSSIGQSEAAGVELIGCRHRAPNRPFCLRALQTSHDEEWGRMWGEEVGGKGKDGL